MAAQENSACSDFSEFDFESIKYGDIYKTKKGQSGMMPKYDKSYNNTSQTVGIVSAPLLVAPFSKCVKNEDGSDNWNLGFSIPKDNNDEDSKELKEFYEEEYNENIFDITESFYQKFGPDLLDHLVEKALEKCDNWFGESLEEEVLREMLTPFIRPETEKDDRTYPPTLNFRLNQKYMNDIKFFDKNKKIIKNPNLTEIFSPYNMVKIIFTYGNIDIDKGKASFKPHFYPKCFQFIKKNEKRGTAITNENFEASKIGFKLPLQENDNGKSTKIIYDKSTLSFDLKNVRFLPFVFEGEYPGSSRKTYTINIRLPSNSFERKLAESMDESVLAFLKKNSKTIYGKSKTPAMLKRIYGPLCKFGNDKEQDPIMKFNITKNKSDNFNLNLKDQNDMSIVGDDNILSALTNEEGRLNTNRSYNIAGYCMHMWIRTSGEVSVKMVITNITMNNANNNSSSGPQNYSFGASETIDNGEDEDEDEQEEEIPDSDED